MRCTIYVDGNWREQLEITIFEVSHLRFDEFDEEKAEHKLLLMITTGKINISPVLSFYIDVDLNRIYFIYSYK